jgi:Protein of unknown function (DUF2786)
MSDKIKQRIEKLLAMSRDTGASENEVEQALTRATELMIKHNISEKDLGIQMKAGDMIEFADFHKIVGMAVAQLFGVIPVTRGTHIQFVGRVDNVETCEWTMQWVIEQIEHLYKTSLPRGMSQSDRANYRRTFKKAAAIRVLQRVADIVRKIEAEGVSDCTALVVVDQRKQLADEAKQFAEQQFSGLRSKTTSLRVAVTPGAVAGRAAGDRVQLNKKVG